MICIYLGVTKELGFTLWKKEKNNHEIKSQPPVWSNNKYASLVVTWNSFEGGKNESNYVLRVSSSIAGEGLS